MRTTVERELKLDADASFVLPALDGDPLDERLFTSTYHDTAARSLGVAGITLRRRVENGKSLWQLKLPRGDARAEIEEAGGPAGPPESIARLLAGHARHGRLEPVATLRTRRRGVRVTRGGVAVAEVTIDHVDVLDAGHAAGGFTEIEVELVGGGSEDDLKTLGKTLREAGARRSAGTAKALRVIELPPERKPGSAFRDQLQHLLDVQRRELEAHDPGVRLGEDPEDVHKFRVATRRTRALVRATEPLLGETLAPLAGELRWLAGILGPVRDLDVLIERLRAEAAALGEDREAGEELVGALAVQRERCREALLEALASPRYAELLGAFETAVASLPPLREDADAAPIARAAFRKLRTACGRLPPEPTDEELHAVRKKAKRARYAAELAALGAGKRAARAAESVKDVQDVIGEHQDAVVAEERLRRLADARTALAAGRLIEREAARRRSSRAAYPAAVDRALTAGEKAFGR